MSSFACYRFPHDNRYTCLQLTEGEPEELSRLEQLNGRQGFVMAPFSVTADCPILLFPEEKTRKTLIPVPTKRLWEAQQKPSVAYDNTVTSFDYPSSKDNYPFARFHQALCERRFSKLVLARTEELVAAIRQPQELFEEACARYPRMFVALVSAPRCGTWLMATPEVLLKKSVSSQTSQEENAFETMALAGTMKLEGELLEFDNPSREKVQQIRWSQKNIQEQRYVASYIHECLKDFATSVDERGPYTTRAANLVHLRSDFRFVLRPDCGIGSLLEALHPTPAVCGLPKEEARAFILDNEPMPRRYYSGFCGPLNEALYVSLRCVQIEGDHYRLYAGGGLLCDSVEQQEWEETEAKMQTMKLCIATKRM